MLQDLKIAAEKIARGSTEISVKKETNDVMGSLADCIAEIAQSNHELSDAAKAIGNGNFNVKVVPRSEEDVLTNAIIQMKNELSAYSERMEALVKERTNALEKSNKDLQQFAHVVSHDLKEPLRKMRAFTERLMMDDENQLTESSKNYLVKIAQASNRMTKMIDGILTYSSAGAANELFELVDLKTIVENVRSDLELLIEQKSMQLFPLAICRR
jgi:light-regulated signal transduction histidine kinase (bacteriophytochrome)